MTARALGPGRVALVAALLQVAAEAQAPERVTEERLRAAYADARAAIETEPGAKLDPPLEMRLVGPQEIARCVEAENLPMVRLRQPDEAKAAAEAEAIGAAYARLLYAKYSWSGRELLVVPSAWESNARTLARPELTSDAALRAVLVHELVHGLDDRRFDLGALLARTPSTDAATALNACIEGHAQHVARRVCAAQGWRDGFEAFTAAVGAIPDSVARSGEAVLALARAESATLTFAYHDGERFVAAVEAAGGADAVARIFAAPPVDGETILRPAWHLDPSSRPAVLYDPEPALDLFAARFDAAEWSSRRLGLQSNQVASSLELLPADEVRRIVASLKAARVISLQPTEAPSSKLALLVVLEFESDEAARAFVAASDRLSKIKDERMKTGVVRITGSKTATVGVPGARGYLQTKTMRNGALEFVVSSIDAARGKLVVETLFSGEPIEPAEHVELVERLLDAAKVN